MPRSGEEHTTSPASTSPSVVRCLDKPLSGPVPRQAPQWSGASTSPSVVRCLDKPLERGHPTRRAAQVGRVPPQTTPLLSVWGCEWGPTPLSSTCCTYAATEHTIIMGHIRRSQVRLAAAGRAVHSGGFGTFGLARCGPLKRLGTLDVDRAVPRLHPTSRCPT